MPSSRSSDSEDFQRYQLHATISCVYFSVAPQTAATLWQTIVLCVLPRAARPWKFRKKGSNFHFKKFRPHLNCSRYYKKPWCFSPPSDSVENKDKVVFSYMDHIPSNASWNHKYLFYWGIAHRAGSMLSNIVGSWKITDIHEKIPFQNILWNFWKKKLD